MIWHCAVLVVGGIWLGGRVRRIQAERGATQREALKEVTLRTFPKARGYEAM